MSLFGRCKRHGCFNHSNNKMYRYTENNNLKGLLSGQQSKSPKYQLGFHFGSKKVNFSINPRKLSIFYRSFYRAYRHISAHHSMYRKLSGRSPSTTTFIWNTATNYLCFSLCQSRWNAEFGDEQRLIKINRTQADLSQRNPPVIPVLNA